MPLRELQVDMESVLDAMDDYGDAPFTFLDVETGEARPWFDPIVTGEEPDFDCDEDRWEKVPRREAHEKLHAMQHFVHQLDEDDVRERLQLALAGRGAFGRFRAELSRHPDLQARWFAEDRAALLADAIEWLHGLGIEPRYTLRQAPPPPPPPPAPKHPQVDLFDLLVLGAPGGKTELIEGRVFREYTAADPAAARAAFVHIARQITELDGVGWRRRFVADRDDYECGRYRLRVAARMVTLSLAMPRPIWDEFCR
ncbi:MAG: hypothetical protein FJ265_18700 [Planctomycetes bacterium]|nr:hypothetical protein [Planctomycetota bacterium]